MFALVAPYGDELIRLPLPFMATLIVRAYHINPTAAQQTIDYFINHTNQAPVAGRAMAQIALTRLTYCETADDIGAVARELTWIPSPPPASMNALLPQCLAISQDVQAALKSTSIYRQHQGLEKPLITLRQLRQQLPYQKASAQTTQLGQISYQWLSILETAQKNLADQLAQSKELPQVYIAGPPLERTSTLFRGRQDLFREIENLSLSLQPPTLLLYGGRRTGKTSSLKYLPQRVDSELIPLLVDAQGLAESSTLLGLALGIAKQISEDAQKTHHLRLPSYDKEEFKEDPFPALRHWFKQIEKQVDEKKVFYYVLMNLSVYKR